MKYNMAEKTKMEGHWMVWVCLQRLWRGSEATVRACSIHADNEPATLCSRKAPGHMGIHMPEHMHSDLVL